MRAAEMKKARQKQNKNTGFCLYGKKNKNFPARPPIVRLRDAKD
jgi:hypothetical protein